MFVKLQGCFINNAIILIIIIERGGQKTNCHVILHVFVQSEHFTP